MGRWWTIVVCVLGMLVLMAAVLLPVIGIMLAVVWPYQGSTEPVPLPAWPVLLAHSLVLSLVTGGVACLLGLAPAAVLGSAKGGRRAVLYGLVMTPLLLPPHVHAYAWELVLERLGLFSWLGPGQIPALSWWAPIQGGLISAGWLWPMVALIVAAGWRVAGRSALMLAILDTTPARAYLRAVLPTLRHHLAAAMCLVLAVTLIEYPIPHMTLNRVYATELMLLADAAAPMWQILAVAGPVWILVFLFVGLAGVSLRATASWHGWPRGVSGYSRRACRSGQ